MARQPTSSEANQPAGAVHNGLRRPQGSRRVLPRRDDQQGNGSPEGNVRHDNAGHGRVHGVLSGGVQVFTKWLGHCQNYKF